MSGTIKWEDASGPNIIMEVAVSGNRKAELVRKFPGDWFLCAFVENAMCGREPNEPATESKAQAKARGERFLKGKTQHKPRLRKEEDER